MVQHDRQQLSEYGLAPIYVGGGILFLVLLAVIIDRLCCISPVKKSRGGASFYNSAEKSSSIVISPPSMPKDTPASSMCETRPLNGSDLRYGTNETLN